MLLRSRGLQNVDTLRTVQVKTQYDGVQHQSGDQCGDEEISRKEGARNFSSARPGNDAKVGLKLRVFLYRLFRAQPVEQHHAGQDDAHTLTI